jgi:hypothetical protein
LARCTQSTKFETMANETAARTLRLGECLETLLEHLGPAEQRALAATSRRYRAAVAAVHAECPDTFEALVGAPGAWAPVSLADLGAIDTRAAARGGRWPELRLNLARASDKDGRVRVPTRGWHVFGRISFARGDAARDLGDDFLRDCAAHEVDYAGCTGVARAGDDWMRGSRVDRVRYAGLDALAVVGDAWMTFCESLAAPDFAGLGALAAVGDNWMAGCKSLAAPDFAGLGALASVGSYWMTACVSLAAPDFAGLAALAAVGDGWMMRCKALAAPDLSELGALAAVGSYWMASCKSLATPCFVGLAALAAVGDDWMWRCKSLATPSFAALGALAAVGDGWMADCPALGAVVTDPTGHAARRAAALQA